MVEGKGQGAYRVSIYVFAKYLSAFRGNHVHLPYFLLDGQSTRALELKCHFMFVRTRRRRRRRSDANAAHTSATDATGYSNVRADCRRRRRGNVVGPYRAGPVSCRDEWVSDSALISECSFSHFSGLSGKQLQTQGVSLALIWKSSSQHCFGSSLKTTNPAPSFLQPLKSIRIRIVLSRRHTAPPRLGHIHMPKHRNCLKIRHGFHLMFAPAHRL